MCIRDRANWSNENPQLAAGEFGYDTTNNSLKVGDGTTTIADFIEDERDNEIVDTEVLNGMRDKIADAIASLNEREMGVMEMRFGMPDGVRRTLEEVGDRFQVTRERIRQIEAKAIRKLTNPLRLQKLEMFNKS